MNRFVNVRELWVMNGRFMKFPTNGSSFITFD